MSVLSYIQVHLRNEALSADGKMMILITTIIIIIKIRSLHIKCVVESRQNHLQAHSVIPM